MHWIHYAVIAMVSHSVLMVILKKITISGLQTEIINFYFLLSTTMMMFCFAVTRNSRFKIPTNLVIWFVVLGFVAFFYNYFTIKAISIAPNPGYVVGILSCNIVIVTIVGSVLFGSPLTATKIAGITMMFCGSLLITVV
ncbi:EamA family transporter [Candidatus Uabimicrobium sp. HlEnr_7]|uniref:EamA family transporter n=1 Tax=Candidatus Uabimicrobium helgolandensis TaxID=3095367 RepID=UPI00355660A6